MAAPIEEQFQAAVQLIQSMPSNGSFQPSNELMLKFYGYFKQATEGPCNSPKPGFWEVVKKAKWDAWKKLGNMPGPEAMTHYVDELKKIAEAMPYTDDMANFMHVLGPFYEAVYPDGHQKLSILLGREVEEKDDFGHDNESGYSSGSQELTTHLPGEEVEEVEVETASLTPRSIYGSTISVTGSEKFYSDTESDGEYVDPEEQLVLSTEMTHITEHDYASATTFTTSRNASPLKVEASSHLAAAVHRLQKDANDMQRRLEVVENRTKVEMVVRQQPYTWWPFPELSPRTALIIALWPFVTHLLLSSIRQRIKK